MKGKVCLIELFKDLLIVLLTISAGMLLFISPLVQNSGMLDLLPKRQTESNSGTQLAHGIPAAAIPLRMTVCTDLGLYGVQYDPKTVDELFDAAGPLLGEALWYAGEPTPLAQAMAAAGETRPETHSGLRLAPGEGQWRALLCAPHIFFGYDEPIPLSCLGGWLKPEEDQFLLDGAARYILLTAFSDGKVALCYQDMDGEYYLCTTELDASLHLDHILESVTPNNAFFAFEDMSLPAVLDPYTLFTGNDLYAPVYSSTDPVPLSDTAQASRLLSALKFSDINRAEGSDAAIYVDNDDTLRLYGNGMVRCHASPGRYPAGQGLDGAVESAWSLASAALAPFCGDARLYLISAKEERGAYTVTFGYCLDGCPVSLFEPGWAAQVIVYAGSITDFSFCLRSYSLAERQALLLPAEKAAAALTALTGDVRELTIRYQDTGATETEPKWVGK